MNKGQLPDSEQIRDMIALPTPCNDTIYYPANLAILGTQGKYSVFQTMSHKSGTSYLCITQPDRIRFRLGGQLEMISAYYEAIPWREVAMADGNGHFFYKVAPSLEEINQYFDVLAQEVYDKSLNH